MRMVRGRVTEQRSISNSRVYARSGGLDVLAAKAYQSARRPVTRRSVTLLLAGHWLLALVIVIVRRVRLRERCSSPERIYK
ncbi:hypothetical protein HYDPIDRAFT_146468, partial [Hydnomerulius pinastri MD-312]